MVERNKKRIRYSFEEYAEIEELNLPKRIFNTLKRNRVKEIRQIASIINEYDEKDFSSIQNFGPKSIEVLRKSLRDHGFSKPKYPDKSTEELLEALEDLVANLNKAKEVTLYSAMQRDKYKEQVERCFAILHHAEKYLMTEPDQEDPLSLIKLLDDRSRLLESIRNMLYEQEGGHNK